MLLTDLLELQQTGMDLNQYIKNIVASNRFGMLWEMKQKQKMNIQWVGRSAGSILPRSKSILLFHGNDDRDGQGTIPKNIFRKCGHSYDTDTKGPHNQFTHINTPNHITINVIYSLNAANYCCLLPVMLNENDWL